MVVLSVLVFAACCPSALLLTTKRTRVWSVQCASRRLATLLLCYYHFVCMFLLILGHAEGCELLHGIILLFGAMLLVHTHVHTCSGVETSLPLVSTIVCESYGNLIP